MGKNFVKETKSELKKVIWPSRQQVINGTGVVIVMVAIVGIIILGFDFLSSWGVQKIMGVDPSSVSQNIEHDHDHEEDVVDNVTDADTAVIPDSNTSTDDQTDVANSDSAE